MIIDEFESLDRESWEVLKVLLKEGIGEGIKFAVVGGFRYHLPGEIKGDYEIEGKKFDTIRESHRLFKNNEFIFQ